MAQMLKNRTEIVILGFTRACGRMNYAAYFLAIATRSDILYIIFMGRAVYERI